MRRSWSRSRSHFCRPARCGGCTSARWPSIPAACCQTRQDPGRLGPRRVHVSASTDRRRASSWSAVAGHVLIAHPDRVKRAVRRRVMLIGGPALYLAGESLFRLRMIGSLSPKRRRRRCPGTGRWWGRSPGRRLDRWCSHRVSPPSLAVLALTEYEPSETLAARLGRSGGRRRDLWIPPRVSDSHPHQKETLMSEVADPDHRKRSLCGLGRGPAGGAGARPQRRWRTPGTYADTDAAELPPARAKALRAVPVRSKSGEQAVL